VTWLWGSCVIIGNLLVIWSHISLPPGTDMWPKPPINITYKGPYKFLKHPMYLGNIIVFIGFGGLAAGAWNALAMGSLGGMICWTWAGMEEEK